MYAGDKIAAAVRENPGMAVWVIYAIWGLLFGAAVLGLIAVIYAAYGLETVKFFLIGLAAAGLLATAAYVLFGGPLSRALSWLARTLFP